MFHEKNAGRFRVLTCLSRVSPPESGAPALAAVLHGSVSVAGSFCAAVQSSPNKLTCSRSMWQYCVDGDIAKYRKVEALFRKKIAVQQHGPRIQRRCTQASDCWHRPGARCCTATPNIQARRWAHLIDVPCRARHHLRAVGPWSACSAASCVAAG